MTTFLRNRHHDSEPVWHLQLVMLATIGLQFSLPNSYSLFSRYFLVGAEVLLLLALSFTTPKERIFRSLSRRINVFLLLILTGFTNSYALTVVVRHLLEHGYVNNGRQLILAAINIYLTNIIIFGIWYWEMDGGGPGQRFKDEPASRDFMFPQYQSTDYPKWRPTFIDYLYVSSTNGMAFSPTDTLPLSRRAKLLMLAQATISLVTVALVAARAVNILT